jgi:hypothetical protein
MHGLCVLPGSRSWAILVPLDLNLGPPSVSELSTLWSNMHNGSPKWFPHPNLQFLLVKFMRFISNIMS